MGIGWYPAYPSDNWGQGYKLQCTICSIGSVRFPFGNQT